MKMNTSWAFASAAVVAILVAGCTTEVTDNSEGGVSTGAAGGGTAGAAGGGTAGDTSTGGGGAGGSSNDTDASGPMSACETCAYAKCKMEADACEADKGANGCALFVDDFYTCLKTANTEEKVQGCGSDFASMVSPMGMSQSLANDLGGCVTDTDPAKGCLTECGAVAGGTSDAGAHE